MRTVISRARVLTVLLVMALTACGSTLQPGQTQLSGGTTDLSGDGLAVGTSTEGPAALSSEGLPLDGGTGTGTDVAGAAAPGAAGPGAGGGGAGTSGAAGNGGGASGSAATRGAAGTGPLRIGIVVVDISALAAVFGSEEDGNTESFHRAFIKHLNDTGGIAGRKVEGEFITVDIASDYNAEGQRACEHFTQDNKVDIVFPNAFSNEVMLACLARNGIAALDTQLWTNDRAHIDHPNWFTPVGMRVDRYATTAIDVSVKQGLLKRGDKLGVLYEDCPWGGRVYREVVQPAAARYGVTTEQATVKCIENLVSDLGPVTNQSRSAVLRFQSANVTHVLVLSAAEGFVVGQFSKTASDQRYYPKYALTSNAWPYNNADGDGPVAFARDQLPNMAGIGFVPFMDVGMKARPATDAQAKEHAECRKADPAMAGARAYEGGPDKATRMAGHHAMCDVYFTLRDIGDATRGSLSIPDIASVYGAVLARKPSALLNSGRFRPADDRRDGIGLVQPIDYSPSARQFGYKGQRRSAS
jgi:hypothetical protein